MSEPAVHVNCPVCEGPEAEERFVSGAEAWSWMNHHRRTRGHTGFWIEMKPFQQPTSDRLSPVERAKLVSAYGDPLTLGRVLAARFPDVSSSADLSREQMDSLLANALPWKHAVEAAAPPQARRS